MSPLIHRYHQSAGFSLLELILAVAVFALVTAGAMAAINSLVNARDAQLQTADLLQQLQLANHNLERDINQLVNRGARGQGITPEPAVQGQSFLLRGTKTGWANPLNQQRSQLQRFQYRIQDQQLLREHWIHVDNSGGLASASTVLLENVNSVVFRYQARNREWQDNWPVSSEQSSLLPRAIEVTLELADNRRIRRVFITVEGANS